MANWDVPDFDASSASEKEISARAENLRKILVAQGKMDRWHLQGAAGFDHATVRRHCVDTSYEEVARWQQVRLSMKGKDTTDKLSILRAWLDKRMGEAYISDGVSDGLIEYSVYVQVYNYLGALRRGGQLDDQNRVRKAR